MYMSSILMFERQYFFIPQVKIAIIGITAGGVGLDFSSAQNVVFLELPQSPSLMLQVWLVCLLQLLRTLLWKLMNYIDIIFYLVFTYYFGWRLEKDDWIVNPLSWMYNFLHQLFGLFLCLPPFFFPNLILGCWVLINLLSGFMLSVFNWIRGHSHKACIISCILYIIFDWERM